MTPASRLPVQPGDRVLDLCAAPGGKATELAAKLGGTGLLVANDISNTRARALLRNLELFGVRNMAVTNESPERLAGAFPMFFDKILVDAPCSGEGMFRKSPDVAAAWSPAKVDSCAKLQKEILEQAWRMLRPGGLLLYSTCTFSPEEDEQQIAGFLQRHTDLNLIPMEEWEGFSSGRPEWADGNPELKKCIRIWPHKMPGEGHFLALLRKTEDSLTDFLQKTEDFLPGPSAAVSMPVSDPRRTEYKNKKGRKGKENSRKGTAPAGASALPDKQQLSQIAPFLGNLSTKFLQVRGENAYYVENSLPMLQGLHFLRNGLFLGEWKKNRFEPSQPLALTLSGKDPVPSIDLDPEDTGTAAFLHGESLMNIEDRHTADGDGWKLVTTRSFPIGWGKLTRGQLKNKIGTSWRFF